jgi:hypothetical protein
MVGRLPRTIKHRNENAIPDIQAQGSERPTILGLFQFTKAAQLSIIDKALYLIIVLRGGRLSGVSASYAQLTAESQYHNLWSASWMSNVLP